MQYPFIANYEVIAKHCPECDAMVMAAVIRTTQGEVYKYRDVRCSQCNWKSPLLNTVQAQD